MNRLKKLFQQSSSQDFTKSHSQDFNGLGYEMREWEFNREHSDTYQYTWSDKHSPAVIIFKYYGIEPDLPTVKNVNTLRDMYRELVGQHNGAIIRVEIGSIQNVDTVETIFKFPIEPHGVSYIGSITIPYKDRSYVLMARCAEVGTTGLRDSAIFDKMIGDGVVTFEDGTPRGWLKDPYDDSMTEGFHMNLSETEEFDAMFPEHPLTVVRGLLTQFSGLITLDERLEKFEK